MFQWRGLLRNRYIVFFAATWLQSSAGTAYMFGMYSQSFKSTFGYNQQMLDGVGMAKDIGGNVGITSGFLGDVAPIWVVLLVGAVQSAFGYGMLYLSLTGKIPVPGFWLVCLYIAIGTNGATFFNTAGLVTNVKNFPNSRGPVVGLLKGYIGLSGAIFTQIYMALYAPDKDAFLLLVAWLPALIAVLVIPLIRPLPPTEDPNERANLGLFMALGVSLAFYLLGASLLDAAINVGRTLSLVFTIGAFLLLSLPVYVAVRQEWDGGAGGGGVGVGVGGGGGGGRKREEGEVESRGDGGEEGWGAATEPVVARGGLNWRARMQSQEKPSDEEERLLGGGPKVQRAQGSGLGVGGGGGSVAVAGRPARGEDHNLLQGFCTPDFWLIYLALTLAAGSGLTVINNLGQIGRAVGYDQNSIGVLVSLLSIWNFLGRVGGGFVSEYFVREMGWPRPAFMAITQALMGVGHLLCASALPGTLYFASGLVGFTYGAQWGIMPAVASELFGLKNFGTFYNWLTITNPTGSYLLSVCVAGYLYDKEAEIESGNLNLSPTKAMAPPPSALLCTGGHCFRLTFYIMAVACLVAVLASTVLSFLSLQYYKAEYERRSQTESKLSEASRVGRREGGASILRYGEDEEVEAQKSLAS